MAMASADRVRIRELLHAYNRSASVRAIDPKAEEVLGKGRTAALRLRESVSRVLAEEADDPPHRAARDRASAQLRDAAVASLRRYRALVALSATDPVTGAVLDQALLDGAEALADTYLPEGNLGGLPEGGPALQLQAGLLRDALASRPEGEPLARNLTSLLQAHGAALEKVALEADELAAERKALEEARDGADRWRRAGWHYLSHLDAAGEIPVDLRSIYPVSGRSRADDHAAADATLDEADAPDVPEDAI